MSQLSKTIQIDFLGPETKYFESSFNLRLGHFHLDKQRTEQMYCKVLCEDMHVFAGIQISFWKVCHVMNWPH